MLEKLISIGIYKSTKIFKKKVHMNPFHAEQSQPTTVLIGLGIL